LLLFLREEYSIVLQWGNTFQWYVVLWCELVFYKFSAVLNEMRFMARFIFILIWQWEFPKLLLGLTFWRVQTTWNQVCFDPLVTYRRTHSACWTVSVLVSYRRTHSGEL
jgi:hypothetical protein